MPWALRMLWKNFKCQQNVQFSAIVFCFFVVFFFSSYSCWVFKQKRMNNCSFTRSLSSSVSPKVFFPHMYVLLVVLSVLIGLVNNAYFNCASIDNKAIGIFSYFNTILRKKIHTLMYHTLMCMCVCVCFHMKTNTQMQWQSIYLLYPVVNRKSIMSGMTKASHGSS